jgi:hypothetical protein
MGRTDWFLKMVKNPVTGCSPKALPMEAQVRELMEGQEGNEQIPITFSIKTT